jgi:hypothetical protein
VSARKPGRALRVIEVLSLLFLLVVGSAYALIWRSGFGEGASSDFVTTADVANIRELSDYDVVADGVHLVVQRAGIEIGRVSCGHRQASSLVSTSQSTGVILKSGAREWLIVGCVVDRGTTNFGAIDLGEEAISVFSYCQSVLTPESVPADWPVPADLRSRKLETLFQNPPSCR